MATSKKTVNYEKAWQALAVARIMLGFIFLWAFFDKLMGLGFSTLAARSWLNGVSPTAGFLKGVGASTGPYADFFGGLAGNVYIDWLFMVGLLGLGLALILGIGLRVAAVTGSILLVMMWAASLPIKTNPVLDDHLVYAVLLVVISCAPRKYSLFDAWSQLPSIKKTPWLW